MEELEIYIHTSHDGNEIRKVSFEVLNERPQNVSKKGYTFYNDNASDELGVGLFIYNGTNWVNVFTEYKHFKRIDNVTDFDIDIDDTIDDTNNTISIIKKLTITDEGHIKDIEFIDIDYNHVGAAKAMHTHNTEDIIFNSPDRLLGSTNDGATFELSADNVLTFLSIAKGEIGDLINYNQLDNQHRVWTASTIIEYVSSVVGQQITGALVYQNTGYIGQNDPGTLILPIPEGGATIPIDKGMVWVVSTDGFFGTERVEGGDMIIALVDNATNDDDFQVINKNITLVAATSLISGLVKLFSDTIQTEDANDVTSTSGKTYGIQANSSGQLVVNVPWTDNGGLLTIGTPTGLTATGTFAANQSSNTTITLSYDTGYQGYTTAEATKLAGIENNANNYTLPTATDTILGGVKLFSNTNQTVAANSITSTATRTYGIQTNASGQLVVNVPWVDTNIDTTYSGSTSIILSGTSFQRAALTGDVTASQNSNATTIANNAVTFTKMQNIATQRLLGRGAAGSGNIEEITLGSGISLSTAGVLSATGNGGTVTSVAMSVPTGLTVTGSPITSSGTLTLGFASGYSLPTITKQGNWDTAFSKTIKAVAVTGTTTKTITLTREDDTVLTANWTDYSADTITRLRGTTTGTYTSGDLTLLAGTNVTISQSGSNFTISSIDTTYTGGTGISISGTTINNTAPNITQVLSLSGNILSLSNGGSSVTLPSATRVGTTSGNVTSGDILIVGGGSASVSKSGNTITITGTNSTYTAGNGLTLSSGVFSMGTPSAISLTSTNSATSTSHTHEFAPGGTSAQYIRGDGSLATMPTVGNGSLTIGTPTGLSSSGTFTANQSGNSTITLAYGTGYQGYTTAEATKLAGIEDNANNYTLPTATDTVLGGVKLFSNTNQTVVANSITSTAARTYGIQTNASGQLVVNVPWVDTNTNTTYTGSTSISLVSGSFQRAALTGDVTSAQNSNVITIANNAVTFPKMQNIDTQRLLGRGTAGTGNIEELTLGTGLSLSTTGILSATGSGGTVTSVGLTIAGNALNTNTATITNSGTFGLTWAGTSAQYVRGDGSLATMPTMPTVGNGSLSIGTPTGLTVTGTFTANQSGNSTISLAYTTGYQGYTTAEATKLAGIEAGANNYTLPTATDTVLGGVKLFSNTTQTVAATAVSATASRTYGIQTNASGQLVVNVPWVNTNTNTTYTAGNGLTLTGTAFSLPVTVSGSGNYVSDVVANATGLTVTKATLPVSSLVTATTAAGVSNVATTNTNTFLNIVEGGASVGSSTQITGTGSVTVTSDSTGKLTINGVNTNTTYSGSTSIILSGTSFQRAALTGDVTSAQNSNATTIANNVVTFTKMQNISTQTILGRYDSGTGNVQEITLGSGLSLSALGVLSSTSVGGTVTSVAMTVPTGLTVTGSPITSSGTLAVGFASGYSLPTTAKQGQWDVAYGWGNHAGLYSLLNHTHVTSNVTALTGYTLGTNTALTATMSLNTALGNLQAQINTKTNNSGTVTSVGMTIAGNALNTNTATITSSGTFGLTWGGTAAQYVNGQGALVTFPTIPTVGNGTLTLSTSADLTGSGTFTANQSGNSSFTVGLSTTTINKINNGQTAYGWGNHSSLYVPVSEYKNFGNIVLSSASGSTADFIARLTTIGFFNYRKATGKASLSYAGNQDITDTPYGAIETAGAVIETWHYGSTFNIIVYCANTGGSTPGRVFMYNDQGATYSPGWREIMTDNSPINGYVPTSRTVTAGNGLTGGGALSGNITLTMGTPGAITLSSTNSVASTSHTHAFAPGGTTAQYIRGDGSLATYVNTTYTAGTGLSLSGTTFGQAITTSGTGTYVQSITQTTSGFQVNLGTPPNTNTTYSVIPIAELNTGTATTGRLVSAAVLTQWIESKGYLTSYINTVTRIRGTASGTYTSGDLTLLAGSNVSISQSGSNITINATNTNTTYTGGTGISISGTTINNTAPNITQVLSLSGSTLTLSNGGGSVTLPSGGGTYSAGNGLTLTGTTFSQTITTTGSGTFVQSITQTANGFQLNMVTPPNTNTITSIGVNSNNYTSGNINLIPGSNMSITKSGNNITFNSTGGGGTTGQLNPHSSYNNVQSIAVGSVKMRFHEHVGLPPTRLDDTSHVGNMFAYAIANGTMDFYGSYDNVQTIQLQPGDDDIEVDTKRNHITNVVGPLSGLSVYLHEGLYSGDQININILHGSQINLGGSILSANGLEVRTFCSLIWDLDLVRWVVVSHG